MDRFIVKKIIDDSFKYRNLKSNMDRFIVLSSLLGLAVVSAFKIQYG